MKGCFSYLLSCIILSGNILDVYTRSLYLLPTRGAVKARMMGKSLPAYDIGDEPLVQYFDSSFPVQPWSYGAFNPAYPIYQSDFVYPDDPVLLRMGLIKEDSEQAQRRENLLNFLKSRHGVTLSERHLDEASPEIYFDFENSPLGKKTFRRRQPKDMQHYSGSTFGSIVKKNNPGEDISIFSVNMV